MTRDDKIQKLYHAVNRMMARLGAEGEISARDTEADEVMSALDDLDGGVYNQGGI